MLIVGNNHFQGVLLHRIVKSVIRLHDIVQCEVVRDQLYWLYLARHDSFQKHWSRYGVNEARCEGDVV